MGIAHTEQTQRLWRLSASWMYRSKPMSFPCCRYHATVSTAQSGRIPACTSRVMESIKSHPLQCNFRIKKGRNPIRFLPFFGQFSISFLSQYLAYLLFYGVQSPVDSRFRHGHSHFLEFILDSCDGGVLDAEVKHRQFLLRKIAISTKTFAFRLGELGLNIQRGLTPFSS